MCSLARALWRVVWQIVATLRTRYEDLPKMEAAVAEMRAGAEGMPGLAGQDMIAVGKPAEVFLWEYSKEAVEVRASIHIDAANDQKQAKQDFLFALAKVLEKNGVKFQPSLALK